MKCLHIREAIMDDSITIPGYVYVVRDKDIIFYVGSSKDPTHRLAQHLGLSDAWGGYTCSRKGFVRSMEAGDPGLITLSCSQLGECIIENAPESLNWSFDIYEQEDAIIVMSQTSVAKRLPQIVDMMKVSWYNQMTSVEKELIVSLQPYLNSSLNIHERDIPTCYRRRKINLENNVVDHIRL